MLWLLTTLACDMAEEWCLGAGLDAETCSDPATPVEGPWTLMLPTDAPLADCDLRPVDLDDGWILAPAGPAFTLAPPAEGDASPAEAAPCTLDAGAFACETVTGPSGAEVTVAGELASRSEGSVTVTLASSTCATVVDAPFVASWTLEASADACPDVDDDSFAVDASVAEVTVQVTNAGDQALSLFLLGGDGPVLLVEVPAGATSTGTGRPGNWMMLATGFGQEACVFAFEVVEDGQEVTYWGT